MLKRKMKELLEVCFDGDVVVSKRVLWLAGAVCLLTGIVYGLKTAPWTHGVHIGCYNSSQNDCTFQGDGEEEKKKKDKK